MRRIIEETKCDNCDKTQQREPRIRRDLSSPKGELIESEGWIQFTRNTKQYDFCCNECLVAFLSKPKPEQA